METNTKLPDYSGITNNYLNYFHNNKMTFTGVNAGDYLSDDDFFKFGELANKENEELKAKCEAYAKDYNSMVEEVQRLSRSNGELLEALRKIEAKS